MENPLTHKYVQPIKLESFYWLALIEHTNGEDSISKIQVENRKFNSKVCWICSQATPFSQVLVHLLNCIFLHV